MKTFDEVYDMLPGNGWLSRPEAELLWRAAASTDGMILEVGCHEGRSTCLLASFGRQVLCVDPWAGVEGDEGSEAALEAFKRNVIERGYAANVFVNRVRVEDWCPNRNYPKVGLAYLDGDHTFSGTFNQLAVARLCRADVVLVHDCNDSGGGLEVKRACLMALGKWQERAERLALWKLV